MTSFKRVNQKIKNKFCLFGGNGEKKMTFKEKLIVLRKNKGLTQDDFAKAVGVSRQAVYKWENGTSYPEVPKLLEIKALYGISLDDLFDDSFEVAVPEKKKRKRAAVAEKAPETKAEPAEIKPEPKAEPVAAPAPKAEEPVVIKEEPKAEPVEVKAEPAPAPEAEEPANDAAAEQADAASDKKVGFFGRLFGRR